MAREKADEVRRLRGQKLGPSEIARRFGISGTSVHRVLKADEGRKVSAHARAAPVMARSAWSPKWLLFEASNMAVHEVNRAEFAGGWWV